MLHIYLFFCENNFLFLFWYLWKWKIMGKFIQGKTPALSSIMLVKSNITGSYNSVFWFFLNYENAFKFFYFHQYTKTQHTNIYFLSELMHIYYWSSLFFHLFTELSLQKSEPVLCQIKKNTHCYLFIFSDIRIN